jgi:rhodanese-related sulfurtransferase
MSSGQITIDNKIISRFFPLNTIDEQYLGQIQQNAIASTAKKGEAIIKSSNNSPLKHYLISGAVEVRLSFDHRYALSSSDEQAQFPLEDNIREQGTIRATENCQLLIVNSHIVDQFKAWSQNFDYEIVHLHNSDKINNDDAVIEDCDDKDWTNQFIQTALASNLSASDLHKLFTQLESREVLKDEVIVQCNTNGDYFYILQSGTAEVITDPSGPYSGQRFELSAGDYFGDEALVADTMRNASVVMTSDGMLGCLSRDAFNSVVKEALVKVNRDLHLDGGLNDQYHYIDVRLPLEFRSRHIKRSENIPISHLRKHLDSLDYSKIYFITPEGGRRSELATYLMRQAGFEAYCMVNG